MEGKIMKSSLSKVAVAVACFSGSMTIDHAAHGVYFDEEGAFVKTSAPLLRGIRWTTNRAHADDCFGGSLCVRFPGFPPRSPFEPFDPRENFDPDADPGGSNSGGSGSSSQNDQDNQFEQLLNDPDTRADLGVFVTELLSEYVKQLEEFREFLTPAELARANNIIDGLGRWAGFLNSGQQLTRQLLNGQNDAAFAEATGIIAGILTGAFGAAVLGTSTPAVIIGITASIIVSTGVEFFVNEAQIVTRVEIFFTSFRDNNGETFPEAMERFICTVGGSPSLCEFMPPIILDLNGDGLHIDSYVESQNYIDFDNDGYMEKVSWIKGNDGILFIDKNRNGKLDDYYEFSLAHLAGQGKTDLDGLMTLDINGDGQFDHTDDSYQYAGIWIDSNKNAMVDEGETHTLSNFGIVSINFDEVKGSYGMNGSGVMSTFTYTFSNNQGSEIVNEAYDVMLLASSDGGKSITIDDNTKIVMRELSNNAIDMKKSSEDVEFKLGASKLNGTSDFGAIRTGRGHDHIEIVREDSSHVETGRGRDTVIGGKSDDFINGQRGDDLLRGRGGEDTIHGGRGDDRLFGGEGRDILRGGKGQDTLNGGGGNDLIIGGQGQDIFIVSQGSDVYSDFQLGVDKVKVKGATLTDVSRSLENATQYERGTMLVFSNEAVIFLKNIKKEDITEDDFTF